MVRRRMAHGPVRDEVAAIRLAAAAIKGKITPADAARVHAVRRGEVWEVEWAATPGVGRGPDFEARVTIDADSGRVIDILAGS